MKPLQRSAANRGANALPLSKRLNGCAQGCPAQFMLSSTRIELFCDVEPDVDLAAICAFADSFFDTGRPLHGLGRLKTPPLAMVRKTVPPPIMANAASMTPLGEIMRKFPPEQIVCKRAGSGPSLHPHRPGGDLAKGAIQFEVRSMNAANDLMAAASS